jgi:hypothetical protein
MTPRAAALRYAVDLDVLKARSHISASDNSARARDAAFKDSLLRRDAACIFTSRPPVFCEGTHIIPFHKGDEVGRLPSPYSNRMTVYASGLI